MDTPQGHEAVDAGHIDTVQVTNWLGKQITGVTPLVAEQLCQAGDWTTDGVAKEKIAAESDRIFQALMADEHVSKMVADDSTGRAEFYGRGKEMREAIDRILFRRYENYPIIYDDNSFSALSALVIRPNFVLKLTPTALSTSAKALAAISGILLCAPGHLIVAMGAGAAVVELVQALFTAFERIDDPDEQAILQAILALHVKLEAAWRHASTDEDRKAAIAHLYPTLDDLERELDTVLARKDIQHALYNMKRRNIITEVEGGWRIVT